MMLSAKSKTKHKLKTSALALSPSPLAGPVPIASWEFDAIGTHWWLGIFEPISQRALAGLRQAVVGYIEQFDKTYSRFRADSLVTKIAQTAGHYHFPANGEKMFAFYRQLYEATDGAVTPLIGDVLAAAGYDAAYSLLPGNLQKPAAWDEVLAVHGNEIDTKRPVLLDFGAAGKGYLVDLVVELLRGAGLAQFCVDASGDMTVFGDNALRIGLEDPDDPEQIIGVATLQNRALCGSAGNRRAWQEYHHIMSPFTLRPVHEVKAVWVAATDTLTADGLATALFFVPPEKLRQFSFEYVIVDAQNRATRSPGFPVEMFTRSNDVTHN